VSKLLKNQVNSLLRERSERRKEEQVQAQAAAAAEDEIACQTDAVSTEEQIQVVENVETVDHQPVHPDIAPAESVNQPTAGQQSVQVDELEPVVREEVAQPATVPCPEIVQLTHADSVLVDLESASRPMMVDDVVVTEAPSEYYLIPKIYNYNYCTCNEAVSTYLRFRSNLASTKF
jgi:hypothetical protein